MQMKASLLFTLMARCVYASQQPYRLTFLQFSTYLNVSQFRVMYDVSVFACFQECLVRPLCKAFNYEQRLLRCVLNSEDNVTAAGNLSQLAGSVFSEKRHWDVTVLHEDCSRCSAGTVCDVTADGVASCVFMECGDIHTIAHAELLGGNLVHVGARIEYRCAGSYRKTAGDGTSTCGDSGQWSPPNISCVHRDCWTPQTVQGANSSVLTDIDGTVSTNYTCPADQIVRGSPTACDPDTGTWPDLSSVCCDVPDGDWTRVYRITSGGNAYVVDFWINSASVANQGFCQFRRPDIIDNWSNAGITYVKMELFVNNTVVKYMLFNGTGTSTTNWFSSAQLINSSWSDLVSTDAHTFTLSILGIQLVGNVNIRWFVNSVRSYTNCFAHIGWLGVGYNLYPCDTPYSKFPSIVYVTGDTANHFNASNVALADKLEIAVKTT